MKKVLLIAVIFISYSFADKQPELKDYAAELKTKVKECKEELKKQYDQMQKTIEQAQPTITKYRNSTINLYTKITDSNLFQAAKVSAGLWLIVYSLASLQKLNTMQATQMQMGQIQEAQIVMGNLQRLMQGQQLENMNREINSNRSFKKLERGIAAMFFTGSMLLSNQATQLYNRIITKDPVIAVKK